MSPSRLAAAVPRLVRTVPPPLSRTPLRNQTLPAALRYVRSAAPSPCSTKAIKDVKAGDKVLATDPETGETTTQIVTAEILGKGVKHLVKVTVDVDGEKGSKTAEITATDSHPFWVPELGDWIDATDLKSGEWLRTSAGTLVQISAVERWTALDATVHNLTVSKVHTYYVVAGTTPVLVHNCGSNWGGTYGSLKPANQSGLAPQEINHMPQNASTPLGYDRGPAIRMDRVDHRQVWSTGQGVARSLRRGS